MGDRTVRTTRRNRPNRVQRVARLAVALVTVLSLLSAPAVAADSEPSVDLKVLDAVFFRPLTAFKVLFGTAAFLVAMPVVYLFGDPTTLDEAREMVFRDPAADLFERPLGDL